MAYPQYPYPQQYTQYQLSTASPAHPQLYPQPPASPNPAGPYYPYLQYQQQQQPPLQYLQYQQPYQPGPLSTVPRVFPLPQTQTPPKNAPRSPYRHIYDRKVHFDLPNTVKNPKSPIPGYLPKSPNPGYYPSPYPPQSGPVPIPQQQQQYTYQDPSRYYYPPAYGPPYASPYQTEQLIADYYRSVINGPPVLHKDPAKERKSSPPKPFFQNYHFNPSAFNNPFLEADRVMYYLQLVDFKAHNKKNAPIREHMLMRPIKDGKLMGSSGILIKFVEQNRAASSSGTNNGSKSPSSTSAGSQWALESQPDFDPTLSKDYVGYKNIGIVPNIEQFMDMAVFIPVPLDGTPKDPDTDTIPLPSFQTWSAIVFMEARLRNILLSKVS